MQRLRAVTVALVLVSAGLAGCSRAADGGAKPGVVAPEDGGIQLRIQNNNSSDIDVFVSRGGLWTRIGFVASGVTDTFNLGDFVIQSGSPLRILARPIGGDGLARSDPLSVPAGQMVTFTIQPHLAASFATVR